LHVIDEELCGKKNDTGQLGVHSRCHKPLQILHKLLKVNQVFPVL